MASYAPFGHMEQLASTAAATGVGGGVKISYNEENQMVKITPLLSFKQKLTSSSK